MSENIAGNRLARVKTWLANDPPEAVPPLSFSFGERQLPDGRGELARDTTVAPADSAGRTWSTVTYRDQPSGLVVRCEAVEYSDLAAVEWTPYFRNDGKVDLPILSNIQALDLTFERQGDPEFVLYHATGSPALATDYEPRQTRSRPRSENRSTTKGGSPSTTSPFLWAQFKLRGLWPPTQPTS